MEVVAHRAGNTAAAAAAALGRSDMIELDVHVLRGRVELRHAKVLHPTRRLWEKWYLLPRGSRGVPIADVLAVVPADVPLMIDLKCFTRRSARLIAAALPEETPVVASTRNWWVLKPFRSRPDTRYLYSCGTRWQLWWALHLTNFDQHRADHGVCLHERRATDEVIRKLQARTDLVFAWGVNARTRCDELHRAGLTGIITDCLTQIGDNGSVGERPVGG